MLRLSSYCCSWLLLLAGIVQAQQPLILVGPVPRDPRLNFPQVEVRQPGAMQIVAAPDGEKVTWTVLKPVDFRAATVKSDYEITVVFPKTPLYLLCYFGSRSQLVIISPEGQVPPDPTPTPGPTPPPTPPTPPPTPPDVKNDFGVGLASWTAAQAVQGPSRASGAAELAKTCRGLVLKFRQNATTAGLALEEMELAIPKGWESWWAAVKAALRKSNESQVVLSRDQWMAAFAEIAGSLELVK